MNTFSNSFSEDNWANDIGRETSSSVDSTTPPPPQCDNDVEDKKSVNSIRGSFLIEKKKLNDLF